MNELLSKEDPSDGDVKTRPTSKDPVDILFTWPDPWKAIEPVNEGE